ncbi:hypothetical protein L0B52_09435 [Suttonella sp. R2A3]|uniref:hypothetical protein n=1 Tax=Suttonella sp. R2A3 TaxID=2908648 RepID=UPI001F22BFBA|nr:hypothetical protein [Suttonella sp. R2A3]UJF24532.1 hypothetical protein L0B52_09435 [Suttonella sp. R2A3]
MISSVSFFSDDFGSFFIAVFLLILCVVCVIGLFIYRITKERHQTRPHKSTAALIGLLSMMLGLVLVIAVHLFADPLISKAWANYMIFWILGVFSLYPITVSFYKKRQRHD